MKPNNGSDPEALARRVAAGESIQLRGSRGKRLDRAVLGLLPLFMTAVGSVAVFQAVWWGIPWTLIFGALALYALVPIHPRSTWLRLDSAGFTVRFAFITRRWDWDSVRDFQVYSAGIRTASLVTFRTTDPRERPTDFLAIFGIVGITRTTTIPDTFRLPVRQLRDVMQAVCELCGDGIEDLSLRAPQRAFTLSRALENVVALLALAGLLFGSALAAFGPRTSAQVWMGRGGLLLFSLGGAVLIARMRKGRALLHQPEETVDPRSPTFEPDE